MQYKFDDIAINSIAKRKPTDDDIKTYIGLEHLEAGSLCVTNYGSKVPIKGEKLLMTKGDILFGRRNTYLKRAAIAPHDGLFSAHGMILRPKEEVIAKEFFPFFIGSDYFFDAAIRISVGSISPTVNWGTLKVLEFMLPSIGEQKKLAKMLWAANEAQNAYKTLLLLTEQIVKSRFVEMFGDPVTNPMGWETIELGDLTNVGSSKRIFANEYVNNGIPFYRTKEIVELSQGYPVETKLYISQERFQTIADEFGYPKRGDLLVSAVGTIGVIWVIDTEEPFYYKDGNLVLISKCERIHGLVLKMILERLIKKHIDSLTAGSAYHALTIIKLKHLSLPLPPLSLQNRFAEFVRQADKSKFAAQRQTKIAKFLYNNINGG